MTRRPSKSSTAFLDILFNILLGFFTLLVLAIALVNPPTKKADIELKAEVLITLSWPDKNADDVDLFMRDPTGNVVYFRNRDIQLANLDRDDVGIRSDTITTPSGKVIVLDENWEHITIRRLLDGEYVVNILMFQKREAQPTTANVKVEQLNPYKLLYVADIELFRFKQEETVLSFEVNRGKIVDHSTDFKSVVFGTGATD